MLRRTCKFIRIRILFPHKLYKKWLPSFGTMENKSLLFKNKDGGNFAQQGIDLGIGAIFVLAIGLTIAQDVIDSLNLTGVTATVAGFISLVIVAAFIFAVAKLFGLL